MSNPTQKKLIAKMTITKPNAVIMVEINSCAGFNDFYIWWRVSNGQREKIRTASRNDARSGFTEIEKRFPNAKVTIEVFDEEMYRHFLAVPIHELPGYKPVISKTKFNNVPLFGNGTYRTRLSDMGTEVWKKQ